jgi:predicted negative regulator of RcsB-dependent stress response
LRQSVLATLHDDVQAAASAWLRAQEAADRCGDHRSKELVVLQGSSLAVHLPHLGVEPPSDAALESWRHRFREEGDDEGLALALVALGDRSTERAQWGDNLQLLDELESVAGRLGDASLLTYARREALGACIWGPPTAAEALERVDRMVADPALQLREVQVELVGTRGLFLAMLDRPEEARQHLDRFSREAEDLHLDMSTRVMGEGYTRVVLGDLPGAERAFRQGVELLDSQREVAWLSTMLPMLGEMRLALGDEVEARTCAERGRDVSPPNDIESQSRWRLLLARLEARAGRHDDAERLAHEGITWALRSDQTDAIGDRHRDLADVLVSAGKRDAARAALETAVDCYRHKGNIPSERIAQALLDGL